MRLADRWRLFLHNVAATCRNQAATSIHADFAICKHAHWVRSLSRIPHQPPERIVVLRTDAPTAASLWFHDGNDGAQASAAIEGRSRSLGWCVHRLFRACRPARKPEPKRIALTVAPTTMFSLC